MISRQSLRIRSRKGIKICRHYDRANGYLKDEGLYLSNLNAKRLRKLVGKAGVTPVRCSCPQCRNSRRNPYLKGLNKLTMQERRRMPNDLSPEQ